MWLCGPYLPNSFLEQTSKYSRMTIKFVSNAAVTRLGFRAVIEATGTTGSTREGLDEEYDDATDHYDDYASYDTARRDNLTYFYQDQVYPDYHQ